MWLKLDTDDWKTAPCSVSFLLFFSMGGALRVWQGAAPPVSDSPEQLVRLSHASLACAGVGVCMREGKGWTGKKPQHCISYITPTVHIFNGDPSFLLLSDNTLVNKTVYKSRVMHYPAGLWWDLYVAEGWVKTIWKPQHPHCATCQRETAV